MYMEESIKFLQMDWKSWKSEKLWPSKKIGQNIEERPADLRRHAVKHTSVKNYNNDNSNSEKSREWNHPKQL